MIYAFCAPFALCHPGMAATILWFDSICSLGMASSAAKNPRWYNFSSAILAAACASASTNRRLVSRRPIADLGGGGQSPTIPEPSTATRRRDLSSLMEPASSQLLLGSSVLSFTQTAAYIQSRRESKANQLVIHSNTAAIHYCSYYDYLYCYFYHSYCYYYDYCYYSYWYCLGWLPTLSEN